jgi:hypothetical protein
MERFKISNPFKVKAVVNVDVTPQSAAADEKDVFTVQPAKLDIPAHEYRCVPHCSSCSVC